jgi:hypothetical protein
MVQQITNELGEQANYPYQFKGTQNNFSNGHGKAKLWKTNKGK